MRQDRKKRKIVIGMLCSVLLLMAVGYAAFAANLNIKGSTNISTSWDVRITNITSKNVVGSASNLENPSYTNLTATFKTKLISPGDSIEYDITVTNNGNIDAILDKITITDSNNPAIIFTPSGLTEGATLLANESKVVTVKVEYSNSVTSQPENAGSSLTVALDFSQNDGHAVTPSTPANGIVYRFTEDTLNIGDSIEGISTTTDPSTLGKNHYLKHEIVDNKITSSEVCFVTDAEYCMKPNDYEASEKLLQSQTQWFTNNGGSCSSFGLGITCYASNIFNGVGADSSGSVDTNDSSHYRCIVNSDGSSNCKHNEV